jgi:hypothetical protein
MLIRLGAILEVVAIPQGQGSLLLGKRQYCGYRQKQGTSTVFNESIPKQHSPQKYLYILSLRELPKSNPSRGSRQPHGASAMLKNRVAQATERVPDGDSPLQQPSRAGSRRELEDVTMLPSLELWSRSSTTRRTSSTRSTCSRRRVNKTKQRQGRQ